MKTFARNTVVENAPERLQFFNIDFLGDMPPDPPRGISISGHQSSRA